MKTALTKIRDSLSSPRNSASATRDSVGTPRGSEQIQHRKAAEEILKDVDAWVGEATPADQKRREDVRALVKAKVDQCDYEIDLDASYSDLHLPSIQPRSSKNQPNFPGFTFWVGREEGVLRVPSSQVRISPTNVKGEKAMILESIRDLTAIRGKYDADHLQQMHDACEDILQRTDAANLNPSDKVFLYYELASSMNGVALANGENNLWFAGEIFKTHLVNRVKALTDQVANGSLKFDPKDPNVPGSKLRRLNQMMEGPLLQGIEPSKDKTQTDHDAQMHADYEKTLRKADRAEISEKIETYYLLGKGMPKDGRLFAAHLEERVKDIQTAIDNGDLTLTAADDRKLQRLSRLMKTPIENYRKEQAQTGT